MVSERRRSQTRARLEIANLFCDLVKEPEGPGHILAKRNQMDLVIARYRLAGRCEQQRGIERRAARRMGHGT